GTTLNRRVLPFVLAREVVVFMPSAQVKSGALSPALSLGPTKAIGSPLSVTSPVLVWDICFFLEEHRTRFVWIVVLGYSERRTATRSPGACPSDRSYCLIHVRSRMRPSPPCPFRARVRISSMSSSSAEVTRASKPRWPVPELGAVPRS